MTAPLPPVDVAGWELVERSVGRASSRLVLRGPGAVGDGSVVDVELERCEVGRLSDAYPVSEHDVEVRVGKPEPQVLTALLRDVVAAVLSADVDCRRVVFAVPDGDLALLSAAEAAGFRFVVDVDLPEGTVSLAVAEPSWVTAVDIDLDAVPHT